MCKKVHNKYMGNKLNNKKGDNMTYTANQIEAIKHLNEYVEDYENEPTQYVPMKHIMETLLENGWTQKTAEGTIGSLVEKNVLYEDDSVDNYKGGKIFIVHYQEVA